MMPVRDICSAILYCFEESPNTCGLSHAQVNELMDFYTHNC